MSYDNGKEKTENDITPNTIILDCQTFIVDFPAL